MTASTAPAGDDFPRAWSTTARETFEGVTAERPDLSAAELASLWHACSLEAAADALDQRAAADGFVATGSTGQLVAHPAAQEARLARTAAAAILARLVPPGRGGAMTSSQRGQAAARARWGGRR